MPNDFMFHSPIARILKYGTGTAGTCLQKFGIVPISVPDSNPDPLDRGTDLDPPIIKQKIVRKPLISTVL
jgi:hypothetical protein